MKFWFLLLVPLILWLTINPCCGNEPENATTVCAENHSEDTDAAEHHPCSPFYGCGTCTGFLFTEATPNDWTIDSSKLIEPSTAHHFCCPKGNRKFLLKPPSGN